MTSTLHMGKLRKITEVNSHFNLFIYQYISSGIFLLMIKLITKKRKAAICQWHPLNLLLMIRFPQNQCTRIHSPQGTHHLKPGTVEYNPPSLPTHIKSVHSGGSTNTLLTPHPCHPERPSPITKDLSERQPTSPASLPPAGCVNKTFMELDDRNDP